MSANIETMFSVRETPWHGLGRIVMDAPASREALELAGLDWKVESRNIYSGTGAMIPGYRANVCWIVLGGDFSDVVTQWHPMGR